MRVWAGASSARHLGRLGVTAPAREEGVAQPPRGERHEGEILRLPEPRVGTNRLGTNRVAAWHFSAALLERTVGFLTSLSSHKCCTRQD